MDRRTDAPCSAPEVRPAPRSGRPCRLSVFTGRPFPPLPSTHLSRRGRRLSPRDCCPLRCHPSWPVSLGGRGLWLFLPTGTASRQPAETCRGVARATVSSGLVLLRPHPPEGAKDQPQPGTGSGNTPSGRREPRTGRPAGAGKELAGKDSEQSDRRGEGRRNTAIRGITCPQGWGLSARRPAACGLSWGLRGRPARTLGNSGQGVILPSTQQRQVSRWKGPGEN